MVSQFLPAYSVFLVRPRFLRKLGSHNPLLQQDRQFSLWLFWVNSPLSVSTPLSSCFVILLRISWSVTHHHQLAVARTTWQNLDLSLKLGLYPLGLQVWLKLNEGINDFYKNVKANFGNEASSLLIRVQWQRLNIMPYLCKYMYLNSGSSFQKFTSFFLWSSGHVGITV